MKPIVLVVGYRRPGYLKQVLDAATGSGLKVFVSLDKSPSENHADWKACKDARRVAHACSGISEIWEYPKALGCGQHVFQAISRAFSLNEKVIILEDDTMPSHSFFGFCEEQLAKHEDNVQISAVCGSRLIPRSVIAGRFASHWPVIWGWASWRRVWRLHSPVVQVPDLEELFQSLPAGFDYEFAEWIHADLLRIQRGELDTWDIQFAYNQVIKRKLSIYPELNLVTNIGLPDASATNIKTWSHVLYRQRHEIKEATGPTENTSASGIYRADRWYSEWICGDPRRREHSRGLYRGITKITHFPSQHQGLGIKGLAALLVKKIWFKLFSETRKRLP